MRTLINRTLRRLNNLLEGRPAVHTPTADESFLTGVIRDATEASGIVVVTANGSRSKHLIYELVEIAKLYGFDIEVRLPLNLVEGVSNTGSGLKFSIYFRTLDASPDCVRGTENLIVFDRALDVSRSTPRIGALFWSWLITQELQRSRMKVREGLHASS
ncbi:hypothetical protein [uncultured Roseibium sp.]|uniref:hypothetical protein n=1 Tax=uncultured Roseibium sp. TaxID=1936171 RepID=UPI00260C5C6C|nr:hypothetical protein [uncultured Roseibium sp.]